jgi:hypothetical protein
MSRDAFIGDTLWQSFPDGTDDTVINNAVQKEVERRDARDKGAVKERQPALPQVAPSVPQFLENYENVPPQSREGARMDADPRYRQEMLAGQQRGAQQAFDRSLDVAPVIAGSLLGGGMAPTAFKTLGAMLGGGVGQGVSNVATRGEVDLPSVGQTTALGGIAPGLMSLLRKPSALGAKLIPGHGFAEGEMAADRAKGLPNLVKTPPSKPMYQAFDADVAASGPARVPTSKLTQAFQKVTDDWDDVSGYLTSNNLTKPLRAIEELITSGNGLPIDTFQKNLSIIGSSLKSIRQDNVRTAVGELYGAAMKDLKGLASPTTYGTSTAPGNAQAIRLLEANAARGKEEVQKGLAGAVRGATGKSKFYGTQTEFNPASVAKTLQEPSGTGAQRLSKMFMERTTPEEQRAIFTELDKLGRYAVPATGESWGGSIGRRLLPMAVGSGIGSQVGGAGAAGIGGLGGLAYEELMTRIFATPAGKAIVKRIMQNQLGGRGSQMAGALFGSALDRE